MARTRDYKKESRTRDYKKEYQQRLARMAAKGQKRDYKREYDQSIQRAIKRGYGSVRQAKRASHEARTNGQRDKLRFAEQWTMNKAVTDKAKYDPNRARDLGIDKAEYLDAFYDAWSHYEPEHRAWTGALTDWWAMNDYFQDFDDVDETEYDIADRYGMAK